MNQWKCALLNRPTYFGLQRLRREVLGGATIRDGVSVAIHAAAHVFKQPGGAEVLKRLYRDLKTIAPSETPMLFDPDPEPTTPTVEPPREQVVQMARR